MKNFIRYLSLLLVFVLMSVSAFAADSASVSFNPETGSVVLTGNARGHTCIYTLPFGTETVGQENMYVDFYQLYATGVIDDYEFYMPDGAEYGKYTVYINDGSASKDSFMYYDKANADNIVASFSGKSFAEVAGIIKAQSSELGIDSDGELYIENSDKAIEILYNHFIPLDDSAEFYNCFTSSMVMAAMRDKTQSDIESLLIKYALNLGIDYDEYSQLDSDHKTDICTLLSLMDFDSELAYLKKTGVSRNFAAVFNRTTTLSAARCAKSWNELKNVFTLDYNSILSEIMSANDDYKSTMANDVFAYMKKNGTFTTYENLQISFDSAVKYAVDLKNKSNKGSSSGSSVRSPSGSSVSIPSGNTPPKDEYDIIPSPDGAETVPVSINKVKLTGEKKSYYDLDSGNWAYDAVSSLGGDGIISGYEDGSFRPDNPITRAEFTKLIVSAFGIKAGAKEFSDVDKTDWFYPYTSVAAGAEIINGYDGFFNPHSNITRQDAAVIIYRLSQKLGNTYYAAKTFADINSVSLYALTAVRSLGGEGIVNGDEQMRFNPLNNLTRAQAAQLLYNYICKLSK